MKPYTIADFKPAARDATKPYRVFAACLDRSLGDFMARAYYLAALKLNREGPTQVTAYWVNDRPYKSPIMAMAPQIDKHLVAVDGEILPLDAFYDTGDRRPLPQSELTQQVTAAHARSDLILTPSMMLIGDIIQFAKLPIFKIPNERAEGLMISLQKRGLDFTRWHATIFYRIPNYKFRTPTPYRDVQDEDRWCQLMHHICDLGGQVVRIGHSGMAEWPERKGFIDLSRDDDIMLHAGRVSGLN